MSSGALPVDRGIDDFVSSKQNKVLTGALGLFTPGCVPSHCHKHTYRSGNRQLLSRAHLCLCGGLMSSAVWPVETLYLHSLITALQKLPLLLGGCLRRRCWSGSLCDHRLHLRLLRKHLCHPSWNRVVQGCVCSTCQWWLWVAEISCKTRLRSSKLRSLDRREGWGGQGENHQGNSIFWPHILFLNVQKNVSQIWAFWECADSQESPLTHGAGVPRVGCACGTKFLRWL